MRIWSHLLNKYLIEKLILYPPPDISSLNIVLVLWPIEHVQKKEIGKSEIFSAKFC